MIGELEMRPGQIQFRHVAGNAIPVRYFTSARIRLAAGVTRLAFRIVMAIDPVDLPVRIVTGNATDTPIFRVVALAVRQTIRLKADIGDAEFASGRYLFPGAVALAAEI